MSTIAIARKIQFVASPITIPAVSPAKPNHSVIPIVKWFSKKWKYRAFATSMQMTKVYKIPNHQLLIFAAILLTRTGQVSAKTGNTMQGRAAM